eukprot:COSAG04_NODE_5117_length_1731_cov_1.189951_2_plen_109_part_00
MWRIYSHLVAGIRAGSQIIPRTTFCTSASAPPDRSLSMPSPAALLLSLLVPSVAAASGGSDFAAWAVGEPALEPHLLPKPHGGTHEWTFALWVSCIPPLPRSVPHPTT